MERFSHRFKKMPFLYLYLIVGEQTGEAGLATWLKAFVDIIARHKKARAKPLHHSWALEG